MPEQRDQIRELFEFDEERLQHELLQQERFELRLRAARFRRAEHEYLWRAYKTRLTGGLHQVRWGVDSLYHGLMQAGYSAWKLAGMWLNS